MAPPTVSVLTTVFNGERFLTESIESVLAQDGVDFELVIVDDGSTDGTAELLDRLTDPRVVALRRPRRGRARALNEAIAHSQAPLLAVHDADDRCLPERLSTPVAFLAAHPEVDLVGAGQWVFIDDRGRVLGRRRAPMTPDHDVRRVLRHHHAPFPHSSVTVRRSALERVGGYDEALPVDLDLDLYVRVAAEGRIATVPEALVECRRHHGQYFGGRQGRAGRLADRVAARRVVDGRARALDGRSPSDPTSPVSATVREAGSWLYWRGRRLAGPRPLLPVAVRRRLDRWWSR